MSDKQIDARDRERILHRAIETYGMELQSTIMIEEAAELIQAIIKFRRTATPETFANLIEEMADVQIMLDQMKTMYGDTANIENAKLERLLERMRDGQ